MNAKHCGKWKRWAARFLAGANGWIKPVNLIQGTTRFISSRNSRLRILLVTNSNTVNCMLFAILLGQLFDDVLHILAAVLIEHQHGVGGFHHHQILRAHQSHQSAGGVNQGVAAVVDEHIAHVSIALGIFGQHVPHGVPSA